MYKLIFSLLCIVSFNLHGLDQSALLENVALNADTELQNDNINGDLALRLSSQVTAKGAKSVKYYANTVNIIVNGGFTFHVGDYYGSYGHSRIVTCLDGDMVGYQGISDNGVVVISSNAVKWHKGYFVHTYPGGKVTSYPNKQICEFK